jgi:endoglucanase
VPQPPPPQPPQLPQPPQPPGVPADPRAVHPSQPNPLIGLIGYIDPDRHPAVRQMFAYARRGEYESGVAMLHLVLRPKFQWFGRWNRPAGAAVRGYISRTQQHFPGTVPLLTVLRHQGRGCGPDYTAGGPAEDARTRRWYESFARGVGNSRVVIAFEPDSLGTVDCLARHRQRARLDTLRYGVDVLSKLPNATIYLEGGASDWEPAERTARQLRYIGIRKVRGFMLNVTHYDWTVNNVRHGLKISRLTGGKHFVVSTSYNGRGPVYYRRREGQRVRRINVWCHPLKRGLGIPPTANTLRPDKVDGYLWIGRPGYSGGSCNGGPLPVGSWWPERALMFTKYATNWDRPPPGTRYGHRARYTLRELGG